MATTSTRPVHGHKQPDRKNGKNGSGGSSSKRPPRIARKRPNLVWRAFLILLVGTLSGLVGLELCFKNALHNLPASVTAFENYRPLGRTVILSSDGVVLANLFQQNRQMVTIDQIPMDLQHATVAIEDKRFYLDHGIDFRGIARALFRDVKSGTPGEGASTLTQQLVRNLGMGGLTREKSISRKVKEALYANKIETQYSKQQIIELYLNTVYYGSGAYGVQAASQVYFGKPVNKLDIAQCAMIAGLVQRPSYYSPYTNITAAKGRRDTVLGAMLDQHYITLDQYRSAVDEPILLAYKKQPNGGSRILHAPYFVDYVLKQLTRHYGADFIYRGGLQIQTTLNWEMQQAADNAVSNGIHNAAYTGATDAALVSIEPQTGYIKAMVGGIDYKKSQFNITTDGKRQPGSSFKPIIYTAALDRGLIKEDTRVLDERVTLPGAHGTEWTPKNDDDRYHGWMTVRNAVAQSVNVVAVKVLQMVGIHKAISYARMMGVKSYLAPYMTMALGADEVTPLEMADVYACIANKGLRPIPTGVLRITDDNGQVLEDNAPQLQTTSISTQACVQMSDMLRGVVTSGTAAAVFSDDIPAGTCGKTGTTQNHLDVWFDGYTKDLVTVVWAGHPSINPRTRRAVNLPLNHEAWGATISAPIWKEFMISAVAIEQREEAKAAANKPKPIIVTQPKSGSGANSPDDNSQDDSNVNVYPGADNTADNTDSSNTSQSDTETENNSTNDSDSATTDNNDQDQQNSTTKVWVDNDTGRPVPVGTPNSHEETFARDYAPVDTNPPSDTSSPAKESGTTAAHTAPVQSLPQISAAPTVQPVVQTTPKMVTVTICADSGLLATKWCPETIDEKFVAGTQPRRHCRIHKPPPGEN